MTGESKIQQIDQFWTTRRIGYFVLFEFYIHINNDQNLYPMHFVDMGCLAPATQKELMIPILFGQWRLRVFCEYIIVNFLSDMTPHKENKWEF